MRVLLTGALGNIGLSTLEALPVEGHDVVAFDQLPARGARSSSVPFVTRGLVLGSCRRQDGLRSASRRCVAFA